MEFRTVDSHLGCIVHKVTFGAGIGDYLTRDWLVPVAIETVPAARVPRANHMVARGNEGDAIAHRFDDTGPPHGRARLATDRQGTLGLLPGLYGIVRSHGGGLAHHQVSDRQSGFPRLPTAYHIRAIPPLGISRC